MSTTIEVYLASQKLSYLDKGGLHLSKNNVKFRCLSFSSDSVYSLLSVRVSGNPLSEMVAGCTYVS